MLALLPSSPSREIRSTGNVSAWERSGLTAAEASSIASFAATLEGYDACRDENMETRLQQRLRNEFTPEERETWHALAGPGKLSLREPLVSAALLGRGFTRRRCSTASGSRIS